MRATGAAAARDHRISCGRNVGMDVFDLLKEEHDQILGMIAGMMSKKEKGDVFEQLRTRIEAHMDGEEEHVYPEIRGAGMKDEILEALEEHHVARIVLGELEDMSDREEAWIPKFKLFTGLLEQHIRTEEHRVFPAARKRISRTRREELEGEYRQFTSSSARAGTSLPRSESPFYREV
jgi:hemerythrin-like domain-containing protein